MDRALHHVGEPGEPGGHPTAHRHVEHLFGQLGHAVHDRAAAGDHHPARGPVAEPPAPPAATSLSPPRTRSRATSVKISSARGWMISDRIWRESWRALRPPTLG